MRHSPVTQSRENVLKMRDNFFALRPQPIGEYDASESIGDPTAIKGNAIGLRGQGIIRCAAAVGGGGEGLDVCARGDLGEEADLSVESPERVGGPLEEHRQGPHPRDTAPPERGVGSCNAPCILVRAEVVTYSRPMSLCVVCVCGRERVRREEE